MKAYEFHPFAEEYPLMPAYDLGRLEESMTERGFHKRFPIVLYKGQVLDGRNRYLAAKAAGVEAVFVTFKGTDAEAQRLVIDANEERRHLAPQWLEQRRRDRIDRVAKAREEGQSLRTIARKEGVSESQVRSDIKSATAQGCAVEPRGGKVTGQDGRTRTATPAKPASARCERCTRVGKDDPACEACKEARKGKPADGHAAKNGKPDFDDRALGALVGQVASSMHKRAQAVQGGRETPAYKDMVDAWERLNAAWKRWQLEKERK